MWKWEIFVWLQVFIAIMIGMSIITKEIFNICSFALNIVLPDITLRGGHNLVLIPLFCIIYFERRSEALREGEEYWITINETSHKEDDTIYLETNLWQYTIKTKNQIWVSYNTAKNAFQNFFLVWFSIVQNVNLGGH